ncbi:Peptidase M20 domain-containing 2 [Lecanosticta acicola]|uniref:Peptidase M20 domain-containing protein 2 n=1 Tax=Lecanosticta acicola TaxID=111012 RepID=A0AAI8Z7B1_9PEZI|nr:Peptidase M20 domain-containing 2 [Lecanosticta acicola]
MFEDDAVMVDRPNAPSQYLHSISTYVQDIKRELRKLSIEIHDNPELQYKEFHAHNVLTNYLKDQKGWHVTPSAYDIKTAFVAVYDSGKRGPVVSFNAEYDALKGIGHACGHNLIAIASVGGALATARLVEEESLGGKVVLFGTPAEEGGGGKIKLLNAGAYRDNNVDISLISHPGISSDSAVTRTAAYTSFKVEYFGREAHAAARPWDGINALDALITAYNAISVLRQQTQPGDIIQGQIINGGLRPNIIHAYASGMFVVRSSTRARREALKKRVMSCFEAGATATGATLNVTPKGSYDDHMPNKTLASSFRSAFNHLGGEIPDQEIDYLTGSTMASTDQGDVSYAMPSISPNFWIRSEGEDGKQLGGPHTPDFERAARTEEAHDLALRVAIALSATAVDVLTDEDLLRQAKREFEEMKQQDADLIGAQS